MVLRPTSVTIDKNGAAPLKASQRDLSSLLRFFLYKEKYSEAYGVPLDKITVEFLILKRKIAKKSDWPISRLQRFEPANGRPTVNKVSKAFNEFRELILDSKGNYKTDRNYNASPGRACTFCEFLNTEHCKWGKKL